MSHLLTDDPALARLVTMGSVSKTKTIEDYLGKPANLAVYFSALEIGAKYSP